MRLAPLLVFLLSSCAGRAPGERAGLVGGPSPAAPPLYHAVVGDGGPSHDGPTVVVLHGGPGLSHDYLRPEWDRLAMPGRQPGRRVVYYDQRGCGRSGDGPPYGWCEDLADLDRVVRHVSPERPVVLAGSSWGSSLALLYAQAHPERVRTLVLSGTPRWLTLARSPGDRVWSDPTFARADLVNRGLVAPRRVRPDSADTGASGVALDERLARPPQLSCYDLQLARSLLWHDLPLASALAAITAPTLFVCGEHDWTHDPDDRSIVDWLPEARVVVLEGLGHDPWLEAPGAFFGEVESFLQGVGP